MLEIPDIFVLGNLSDQVFGGYKANAEAQPLH